MIVGATGRADVSAPEEPKENAYAAPPAPEGPWYIKKDRTYIAQRDDETILKVIAVDRDRWNAYNKARRSIYPCIDMSQLLGVACVPPCTALMLLYLPCICMSCPWTNFCTCYEDIPYPEDSRGEKALVLTDVGIRGWMETKEDICPGVGFHIQKTKGWKPVGITWCVSICVFVAWAMCARTQLTDPRPATGMQGQHQRPSLFARAHATR